MKKKLSIKGMQIMFALIPLTCVLVVLGVISIIMLRSSTESNVKEELIGVTNAVREYYQYDLTHDYDLVDGFPRYDTEYIDRLNMATGTDFTIFRGDERHMTTVRDDYGNRITGTKSSAEVWATVSTEQDYYSDDVIINGMQYYVYYLPLKKDGKVVGMAFSGKPCTSVRATLKQLTFIIIGVALLMEVIFCFFAILVARKVSTPLRGVADAIERMANGETGAKCDIHSVLRETYSLIESGNRLSDTLTGAVGTIRSSADSLRDSASVTEDLAAASATGAAQINDSMSGLERATSGMARGVQDISQNMADMGAMVDDISDGAGKLKLLSEKMAAANEDAGRRMDDMAEGSRKSAEAIDGIANEVKEANAAVARIGEMVSMITDIASQTNLLSLNASIEAARAGDAGRGFGVVASEIKNLAEQSSSSAEQIRSIVEDVTRESAECVVQAEAVKAVIAEEHTLLEKTRERFGELNEHIRESVSEIVAVSEKAEGLDRAKESILAAVNDLSATSEETAATNEEVSVSLSEIATNIERVNDGNKEVTELARKLDEAVAYFK